MDLFGESSAELTYFESLTEAKDALVDVLRAKGVHSRYLSFGGPGDVSTRRPTVPTDARSEFLANRAMGDWAEGIFSSGVREACQAWSVAQYGSVDRIAAGEKGFKEFYLAGLESVRLNGKRPDLLIFNREDGATEDLTRQSAEEAEPIVRRALAAIEVRSSKFEALTYMRIRQEDRLSGAAKAREAPSFTVKVEDLRIVYRWIEKFSVPQSYCQVFFDVVYGINFLDIFRIIGSGRGFQIDKPAKSQEKATIMIPITAGKCVGTFTSLPSFGAKDRVTRLGRHDVYVVPTGGAVKIDPDALELVLIPKRGS